MVTTVKEKTFYADTFGSAITQQRVRVMPVLEAVSVDWRRAASNRCAPGSAHRPRLGGRRRRRRVGLVGRIGGVAALLAEKMKAPSVVAGPTDLVIDPTNLWLTIREIHRSRSRIIRRGDRLWGGLRRNVVRHPGQS